jgi:anti-sigma B factor antagonist
VSELARIEVEELGALPVVRIRGEVDISNAQELLSMIERSVSDAVSGLVVDLTHTTYLDSAAVELLFRLAERMRSRRLELRLLVPTEAPIRAVLELTGLPTVVPLETELDGERRSDEVS